MFDINKPAFNKIASLYTQWQYNNEIARMKQAEYRDVFYSGDKAELEVVMKKIMKEKYNMRDDEINTTHILFNRDLRKFISKKNTFYTEPPERVVYVGDTVNEKLTAEIQEMYKKNYADLALKNAVDLALIHNSCEVRIRVLENRWGNINLDFRPYSPAYYIAIPETNNYLIAEAIAIKEMWGGVYQWTVESAENIFHIGLDGKFLSNDVENPDKVLRYANLRLHIGADYYSGINADDIINQVEASNMLLTSNVEAAIMKGFGILLATNIGDKNEVTISPKSIIKIEGVRQEDIAPNITEVAQSADLAGVSDLEEKLRIRTALNHNLPRSSVGIAAGGAKSGYQEWLELLPLIEARQALLPALQKLEQDVFEIIKRISKRNRAVKINIPDNAKLNVNFKELSVKSTPVEELQLYKLKEESYLDNPVAYLKRQDPDLTTEQAEEKILQNKKRIDEIKKKAGIFDIFKKEKGNLLQ